MTSTTRALAVSVGVLCLLAVATFLILQREDLNIENDDLAPAATTTSETMLQTEEGVVVEEQEDVLVPSTSNTPPGAISIDESAYSKDSKIYFRSTTGGTAVAIPGADVSTFKSLTAFATYPGTNVVTDCAGTASYRFYADKSTLYFYQVWENSRFRSSRVEVVSGSSPSRFMIKNPGLFSDGVSNISLGYKVEDDTSCSLEIHKS